MSERRGQVHKTHVLTKTRRCNLLDVSRSSAYDVAIPVREEERALMRRIDEIHLRTCGIRFIERPPQGHRAGRVGKRQRVD